MDTCYNMKDKYKLELISTCSIKHNHLSQKSNIQISTKIRGKNIDFRLENISYSEVKTNHGKLKSVMCTIKIN